MLPAEVSVDFEQLRRFFERDIPFNDHLGIRVTHLERGHCVLEIPFAPHLVGDPNRPALHGGVFSTLTDAAGGLAVFSMLDQPKGLSTVDLRLDYLRPGRLTDVQCEATVVRAGNRVAVTTMIVRQGQDYIAAEGRGVYNLPLRD